MLQRYPAFVSKSAIISFVLCCVVDVVCFVLLSPPAPVCARKPVGDLEGFDAFFDAHVLWSVVFVGIEEYKYESSS